MTPPSVFPATSMVSESSLCFKPSLSVSLITTTASFISWSVPHNFRPFLLPFPPRVCTCPCSLLELHIHLSSGSNKIHLLYPRTPRITAHPTLSDVVGLIRRYIHLQATSFLHQSTDYRQHARRLSLLLLESGGNHHADPCDWHAGKLRHAATANILLTKHSHGSLMDSTMQTSSHLDLSSSSSLCPSLLALGL